MLSFTTLELWDQSLEASLNHIHKQISLIIYCFPNSDEMILFKKKKKKEVTPRKDDLRAEHESSLLVLVSLLLCVSPDSGADFWHICHFASLLSSLRLASQLKEGAYFNVHSPGWGQADLKALEHPLWLSHGLASCLQA